MNFQEVCRISHNRTETDNTGTETQTYFDRDSDGLVNILNGIESSYFYTSLRIGDYTPGNHHDHPVARELYLKCRTSDIRVPRVRGTLQVYQYERRFYSNTRCSMRDRDPHPEIQMRDLRQVSADPRPMGQATRIIHEDAGEGVFHATRRLREQDR